MKLVMFALFFVLSTLSQAASPCADLSGTWVYLSGTVFGTNLAAPAEIKISQKDCETVTMNANDPYSIGEWTKDGDWEALAEWIHHGDRLHVTSRNRANHNEAITTEYHKGRNVLWMDAFAVLGTQANGYIRAVYTK